MACTRSVVRAHSTMMIREDNGHPGYVTDAAVMKSVSVVDDGTVKRR